MSTAVSAAVLKRCLGVRGFLVQQYEQQVAAEHTAQAAVASAQAQIQSLEVQLGEEGDDNLRLRQANNALEKAELDLAHTVVKAPESGVVANLQLQPGHYVQAGQPAVALVASTVEVVADFREKSLRHVALGDEAKVVFDALPGRIFEGHGSVPLTPAPGRPAGSGWSTCGYSCFRSLDTRCATCAYSCGVRYAVDLNYPRVVRAATVQLVPGEHDMAKPFAWLQAHLISWLHYVYSKRLLKRLLKKHP